MVQRINFIEKSPYAITYKNMIAFALAACVLCLAFHGLFVLRYSMLKSKVSQMKRQVQELTVHKDKALAAMQIAQTKQIANAAPLAALFVKMPAWSTALSDMSKKMPKQIWFEKVKSSNIGDRTDIKKIEITGQSVSNASIAQFVNLLEDSEWFQNTVLMNSHKEKSGYSFVVSSEVLFPNSEW